MEQQPPLPLREPPLALGDGSLRWRELTQEIIGAFFDVYNELGPGFLESLYRAAMVRALTDRGLAVVEEMPLEVLFRGQVIGRYRADLVVADRVIVEIKAVQAAKPEHEAQLTHYLRATAIEIGLLFNFGPRPSLKRVIYSNSRKRSPRV